MKSTRRVGVAVGTASVAVLAVFVAIAVGGAVGQSEAIPGDIPEIRALTGGPALSGQCFTHVQSLVVVPESDDLTREVAQKGRNARLDDGSVAARTPKRLAALLDGELILNIGAEAKIHVSGPDRNYVDTYVRVETDAGDSVWFHTERLSECDGPID